MYQRVQREDVVRIPPERLGEDIDAVARELTRTTLEGKIGADKTLTLIASNIERVGEGRIVHGDGAVYQRVRYDALVFAPTLQEIVEGTVVEILKFGAFVRFGPLDGLLHISQVMDDRVDVDEAGPSDWRQGPHAHRRGLSERTRAARIEDRAHDATTRPRQARLDRRGPRPCGRPRPEKEVSNGRQDPEGVQELFRDHGRGQVPPVRRRDVEGLARLRDHRRPPAVRNREEDGHPHER